MSDLTTELTALQKKYSTLISNVGTLSELEAIEQALFNRKKGELTTVLRGLKELSVADKKNIGQQANRIKQELRSAYAAKEQQLANTESALHWLDTTLPPSLPSVGHKNPLRLVQEELIAIFQSMGFNVYEGNELENELYCFEYLNIPDTHPARDLQDTFYISEKDKEGNTQVLRTHTSNMQVRLLQENTPPFRAIVPGRVFRNEAIDASHEHTFYQMEGFVVGENITVANLTHVLKTAMSQVLQRDIKLRLRPGYFPYVEPGFEADCSSEDGKWLEMLGCGMIHPKVFEAAGYEPGKYTGFAFGMGINRLAMMKYGIKDVRYVMGGDFRVLDQF